MAAGKFDGIVFIFAGGIQWPQGPLQLDPNEQPIWVEAWVVQPDTGAAHSCYGTTFPGNTRWVANISHYRRGNFQPGPAIGTALVWARIGTIPTHFLWTDTFQLR